jgi:hypothetical protein
MLIIKWRPIIVAFRAPRAEKLDNALRKVNKSCSQEIIIDGQQDFVA